jgi:hypothetical protein
MVSFGSFLEGDPSFERDPRAWGFRWAIWPNTFAQAARGGLCGLGRYVEARLGRRQVCAGFCVACRRALHLRLVFIACRSQCGKLVLIPLIMAVRQSS